MGLTLDGFRSASGRPGMPCGVKAALDALPPKDREALAAALAAPKEEIQHAAISRVLLVEADIKLAALTIGRHRHKECSCERG